MAVCALLGKAYAEDHPTCFPFNKQMGKVPGNVAKHELEDDYSELDCGLNCFNNLTCIAFYINEDAK